jgi:hypothetical protein
MIPVIRAEDAASCLDRKGRPLQKEITRNTIPMTLGPVKREVAAWRRIGYAFVAPPGRIIYSEEWGATWAEK